MNRAISGIFALLYYFYCKFIFIKITGFKPKRNYIYCFWHSQIFPLIYTHRKKKIGVLVSKHRDGEIIARILKTFGFQLARGSFKRKGELGLIKMREILNKGYFVAFTPDGPRGPRWVFKEGALFLSKEENIPIILVGTGYSKFIEFPSWDRFKIPLPFSRVCIYLSPPFYVKEINENTKKLFSNLLKEYTYLAFELAKKPNKIRKG